jgi:hypothetical protein
VYSADATLLASFYGVGAALPTSSFAPFTLTTQGSGRIQIQTLKNAAGVVMARELFYDTMLSAPCSALTAADLQQRCLPATAYTNDLFSDAQCQQAIFESPAGTPPPADLVYLASLQTNGGVAIFKIGQKIAAPPHVYEQSGHDCLEGGLAAAQDYYETSTVPASDLVAVATRVE